MMARPVARRAARHADLHVVANADDPMVVWAAGNGRRHPAPTSPGSRRPALARRLLGLPRVRRHDRALRRAVVAAPAATCAGPSRTGRSRTTAWSTPPAPGTRSTLQLPGRVNLANAATALAVAAALRRRPGRRGVPSWRRSPRSPAATPQVERDGRNIRLLLAKNPAGWLEAFDMADDAPTLLSINARDPDGLDTSWLYDVDFSPLRGRQVLDHRRPGEGPGGPARGQRGAVPARAQSFAEALRPVPPGRLEVIANYTAFQDIRAELDRVN